MSGSIADDSAALNTSRDSGEESGTDDERLERRMRRAVLDPAILDRSFSDEESNRVLRSSRIQKESNNMDTAEQPADTSSSGDPGTSTGGIPPPAAVEAMETKQNSSNNSHVVDKVEINYLKAAVSANPSGAGPASDVLPNPSGGNTVSPNPSGGDTLFGHSAANIGAYKAVKALRRSTMVNHVFGVGGGGPQNVSNFAGSFSEGNNTEQIGHCHLRSVLGKKQNVSFSFDPVSMKCTACPGRGEHSIEGGGGGAVERQIFCLSDQNFSPSLPCSNGECLKIMRVEDASLKEIVTGFLDLTRGKEIPTGSVILLFSASHLMLRGVAGYMADFMEEVGRINAVFRGGLICSHGIPILSSGIKDSTLARAILELGEWLKISGELFPQKSWVALSSLILLEKGNGSFVTETFRHPMPIKGSYFTRSWVSGGWTSPSGVLPCSPENEKMLVQTLVREVNCIFNAGLGSEPIMASSQSSEQEEPRKPKFLIIGGSHALQEGEVLAGKGYEVITCAVSGWRANKTASEEMAAKVQEALSGLCEDDIIVVHCCDNTAFMARTEDGGDLPIRRLITGEFHVEGDIVVASKDRLYMFFKNCLPFLTLLAGRLVIFLTLLYRGTCTPLAAWMRNTLPTGARLDLRRTSGKHCLIAEITTRIFCSPAGCAASLSGIRVSASRNWTRRAGDCGTMTLSTLLMQGTPGSAT
jgi:hypothetical protein